jgi:MATE family multidrug resistance protein
LRRGAVLAGLWALGVCLGIAAAYAVLGGAVIDLMTTAPKIRAEARVFLPCAVAAPLLGLAPFMLDGVFIGATRTTDLRNMMALSLALYALAVAVLVPAFGNHGLWVALLFSFVARGVTLWLRYPALERAMG